MYSWHWQRWRCDVQRRRLCSSSSETPVTRTSTPRFRCPSRWWTRLAATPTRPSSAPSRESTSSRRASECPRAAPRGSVLAKFHYTGPTGPARTFFVARVSEKLRWSVRVSDKVRAGPRGSGRARVVECSLIRWSHRVIYSMEWA